MTAKTATQSQSKNVQPTSKTSGDSTSGLLSLELKANKTDWTLKLWARIIAVSLLATAIAFGASRFVVSLKARTIFGRGVDIDLQLALLGLVNKIMDLLITISLEDLAAVTLTLSLIGRVGILGGTNKGIRLRDLEFSQELTKPWVAFSSFYHRCKISGWSFESFVRFALTLIVSVCVLLQGLAINTIGMPKERWYKQATQPYPIVGFDGIDVRYWDSGFQIVGGGYASWDVAAIFSATVAISRLRDLPNTFGYNERGWQQLGGQESDAYLVASYTAAERGSAQQGVVVSNTHTQAVFNWFRANGSAPAQEAIGWNADIELLVPLVSTICVSRSATVVEGSVQVIQDAIPSTTSTIIVQGDSNVTATNATLNAECSLTLGIAFFPVNTWIIAGAIPALSVNKYGRDYNASVTRLPQSPLDDGLTLNLTTQLKTVFSIFEDLVPNLNTAQLLRRNARKIQELRPDILHEEDALAAVITAIGSTLLAGGVWHTSAAQHTSTLTPDQNRRATNIEWQVYGSGPRLGWQWATVVVLAVLLVTLVAAIVQSAFYRLSPAELLKPAGMLVAANRSETMDVLNNHNQPARDSKIEEACFSVQSIGNGRVVISDKPSRLGQQVGNGAYIWGRS